MREIDSSKPAQLPVDHMNRTPGAESDVFESSKTKELHFTGRELRSSASRDLTRPTHHEQDISARRPASSAARSVQSKRAPSDPWDKRSDQPYALSHQASTAPPLINFRQSLPKQMRTPPLQTLHRDHEVTRKTAKPFPRVFVLLRRSEHSFLPIVRCEIHY